jgi:putative OPT family oligopeptide transporter
MILHEGNKNAGGIGFGDPKLPAPQAGLMASLAQGIVGGDMAWPLIGVGIMLGIALILIQVRSPMLVAIGMYLPLATTSAIFVGGMIRWITDSVCEKRGFNAAQRARVENVGILIASGYIAGEALVGLVTAWLNFKYGKLPEIFSSPSYAAGLLVMAGLAAVLVKVPVNNAGHPDEPAPPVAMM